MRLSVKRLALFGALCFVISLTLTAVAIISLDYWGRWGPIMVAFSLFFFGVQIIIKAIDWYQEDSPYNNFPE